MTHAETISESLIRRLRAQYGPKGVDVTVHLANVLEMVHRLGSEVENPAGLLVSWCQAEADELRRVRAAREADREKYADLLVQLFAWVATERPTPRALARVLQQAMHEQYPALNPNTIAKLRALRDWDAAAEVTIPATKASATKAHGTEQEHTGRQHAGSQP